MARGRPREQFIKCIVEKVKEEEAIVRWRGWLWKSETLEITTGSGDYPLVVRFRNIDIFFSSTLVNTIKIIKNTIYRLWFYKIHHNDLHTDKWLIIRTKYWLRSFCNDFHFRSVRVEITTCQIIIGKVISCYRQIQSICARTGKTCILLHVLVVLKPIIFITYRHRRVIVYCFKWWWSRIIYCYRV